MIFPALALLAVIIFDIMIPELVGVKAPIAGLGTSVDAEGLYTHKAKMDATEQSF